MKGKFSNETAERLYDEWNDGQYDGECFDGERWHVLFLDEQGNGHIITEDSQGFVDVSDYEDDAIKAAWAQALDAAECWEYESLSEEGKER